MNTKSIDVALPVAEPEAATVETEFVSVVIPCYNEERFILKALERLADQYDQGRYEIVIVDGLSVDGTREVIRRFKENHPNVPVVVVDNPARNIPIALNLGINAARGSIIARMDAHAAPTAGYVRRCVEVLRQGNVGVVGMPCQVLPGADTAMAGAIAFAASHPFGIGDAKYRLGNSGPIQESVDTVAFSCFRRSLWRELGGFDETLLTNEDYEFNYRVRLTGKDVVLDRSGHCDYFARTTLRGLAAQYSRYGSWKARMVRMHPQSIKVRHLVAPLFVLSVGLLLILGLLWRPFWLLLALELFTYLLLALLFSVRSFQRHSNLQSMLLLPIVFVTIHLAWGSSFLWGLFGGRRS